MAKGGKRTGAGRKADPAKDLELGAKTAQKLLDNLGSGDEKGHLKQLKKIYEECHDARIRTHIIFRMREWAYGKPVQELRVANSPGKKFDVNITSAKDKLLAALSS